MASLKPGAAAVAAAAALLLFPAPAPGAPTHPLLFALAGEVRQPGNVPIPPPEGELEDACGVATDSFGDIYVADYYHRTIDIYDHARQYLTQISDPGPDGPCGLAVDAEGNVYVNQWRREVIRYTPSEYPPSESTAYGSEVTIDFPDSPGARATGVFLDPATNNLYIDNRTYIAVYEAPVHPGEIPTEIGLGTLGQGYGVAVSDFPATAGDIYVPDAATSTVKVYGPAGEALGEIDGAGDPRHGFSSLVDSAIAIDQGDGHIFVADNTEPGFEAPLAATLEFNSAGEYRGELPGALIDAEPSALATDGKGDVFLTSGNSEGASVLGFGPTEPAHRLQVTEGGAGEGTITSEPAGIACPGACAAEYDLGEEVALTAVPDSGSAFAGWSGCDRATGPRCVVAVGADRSVSAEFEALPPGPSLTAGALPGPFPSGRIAQNSAPPGALASELAHQGELRVAVRGRLDPQALPRNGTAPVSVRLGGRIFTADASRLPQLRRLRIELNRHGRLEDAGLPSCPIERIQIASSARALAACRQALVGAGHFKANIVLGGQEPYPSGGRLLIFNGKSHGRAVLLGQIYAAKPFATSFVIVFEIAHRAHGRYGTVLSASLPEALGSWGYLTAIELRLSRHYSYRGRRRSYLSAGCPAPPGFPGALFVLARTSFSFAGGRELSSTLTRSCRVRG